MRLCLVPVLSLLIAGAAAPAAGAHVAAELPAGVTPKNRAAVRELSRDARAYAIVRSALDELPACLLPATEARVSAAPPSDALLGTLGILRLPAAAGDAKQVERLMQVVPAQGIKPQATRRAPLTRGEALLVTPVDDVRIDEPLSAACLRALAPRLTREAAKVAAPIARRVRAELAEYRAERASHPAGAQEGVLVNWLHDRGDAIEGSAATLANLTRTGLTLNVSPSERARLVGVVPDGVASVELRWPRTVPATRLFAARAYSSASTQIVPVRDNVFEARGPKRAEVDAFPEALIWRAADGARLRTVSFDLFTSEPYVV